LPLPGRTVRFGPFQLDLHAAELHYNGSRIKLAEQPFQILAELVQHPGEVVTRDELRQLLWRSDTFVDFEHGLNAAVKRLREVLDDSAESPRYIETVPRRGYRLMVPVESEVPVAAAVPRPHLGRWKIWLVGAVAGVVIAIIAVGPVWQQRSRHVYALRPSDTVVLADFVNSTGDAVFDDTLKQALTVQLEQSPFLKLISQQKVQDTLRLMGHAGDERLTPTVGRELCQRAEGTALLTGSIARLGSQYVIGLTAVGCSSGSLLAIEQERATKKEDVLKALDRAASSLRGKLGESLSSVEKFDTPIWEATTPSLEALKAFSQGRKAWYDQGTRPAIASMQRAIELDPNFAMAYASVGAYQYHLGRYDLAKDAFEKAFALRDRASELERHRISAVYYGLALGDLERSIQEYRLLAQTYPNYDLPHFDIGDGLPDLGRWEEAATEMRETLRLNPDHFVAYSDLTIQYLALNRLDLAEATVKQALLHNGDHSWLRGPMYHLAFLRGDTKQMAQLLQEAAGKEDERALLSAQADTEAYCGRLNRARYFSHRAVESELRAESGLPAALEQAKAGLREAEFGNPMLARRGVAAAMASPPTWEVRPLAALAFARIGDTGRARALVEEMEKDNPSNTRLNVYWLPTIKAAIEMKHGHPDEAITVLEQTLPYELGAPAPLDVGTLYPAYLRGQAYLMMHNGSAAAAEFQKVLDHRGIVLNYPLGALAHLQRGRAFAMSGDNAEAKAAYQDFLTLWKDADPDIPILKQAKAEYAKLQ
jgi:DNA-binding winged helix-turn-helix (wHTH) protein/tetratricopeptide (TPR) repeat protein